MNQKPFAVKIPVAALSPAMPECVAVIVNATGNDSLTDSLNSLYPLSDYRVYITEPGVNQLEATIAHCNEIGLKTIVLCGQTLPDLSNLLASNGIGVSLISAYIKFDGKNYKIPKGTDPKTLEVDTIMEIVNSAKPKKSK